MTSSRPTPPSPRADRLSSLEWLTPIVLALYAPLALLAANPGEVEPASAGRALLFCLALGGAACLVCWLLFRRKERAIVLASLAVLVFLSYGHLYNGLKGLGPIGISLARHRYVLPMEAAAWLGLAILLTRRPTLARPLVRWLTPVAWILILFPVASLIGTRWEEAASPSPGSAEASSPLTRGENPPDVIYVILDAYGRSDVLRDSYHLDNEPFLEFLRGRGFFVADDARSNYNRTILSLASSLNLGYLDDVLEREGGGERSLQKVLRNNTVTEVFDGLGYDTVAFESGYRPTELMEVNRYLSPTSDEPGTSGASLTGAGLSPFEGIFLQTTMARAALDLAGRALRQKAATLIEYEYDRHRERVLYALTDLSEVAAEPGPQFIFAHVVAPHPPFVFGPEGEPIAHDEAYSLHGDSCCAIEDYAVHYADQVRYVNRLLRNEVDEILTATGGNVVIILQGDHGPGGTLDWNAPSERAMQDWMAILNAYYLPGEGAAALYPSISPVNTFRAIFDGWFGGEFDLLEDVSYFAGSEGLSDVIRVPADPR